MIEQKMVFFKNDQILREWLAKNFQEDLEALQPGKVWVACSGGLDSTALLWCLVQVRREALRPFELGILHVNYGLRAEESDGDEAFVRKVAQEWGVHCEVLRVSPEQRPVGAKGIQEWARDLRYAWFRKITGDKDLIALAHHYDDLVETALMRICRGAGPAHLLGMRRLVDRFWRPLLEYGRADLETLVAQQNIAFRVDSSNLKLTYARNRVRLEVLPALEALYPGVRKNLLSLAQDCRELMDYGLVALAGESSSREDEQLSPPRVLQMQAIERELRNLGYAGRVSRAQLIQLAEAKVQGGSLVMELDAQTKLSVRAGHIQDLSPIWPCSERWKQYRTSLLGRSGLAKFTGASWYHDAGSLEPSSGMIDNEERGKSLGLPYREPDDE